VLFSTDSAARAAAAAALSPTASSTCGSNGSGSHSRTGSATKPQLRKKRSFLSGGSSSDLAAAAVESHSAVPGWSAWSHVDMQLVVSRATKHRMLLVRFLAPADCSADSSADRSAPTASSDEVCKASLNAPAVTSFLAELKMALISEKLVNGALLKQPAATTATSTTAAATAGSTENSTHNSSSMTSVATSAATSLDPLFVQQIEDLCRVSA
jgi:hypothetical protein